MFCTKCGVDVGQSQTCGSCGAKVKAAAASTRSVVADIPSPVAAGRQAPASVAPGQRPRAITALAILDFIAGGAALLTLLGLAFVVSRDVNPAAARELIPLRLLIFAATLAGAAIAIAAGLGLLRMKPYGRTLQMGLAWAGLIVIPIGTIVSILILRYLWKPQVAALFVPRSGGSVVENTQPARQPAAAPAGWGIWIAVGVVGVFAIAIAGNILIVPLLRPGDVTRPADVITIDEREGSDVAAALDAVQLLDSIDAARAATPTVTGLPGWSGTVTLNFDSIASAGCVDAAGYLGSFGVTIAEASSGTTVSTGAADNKCFHADVIVPSPPNALYVPNNQPVSFSLKFDRMLSRVSFVRARLNAGANGVNTVGWTAKAYDVAGAQVAEVGEGAMFAYGTDFIAPASFTLSGSGIRSVTFVRTNPDGENTSFGVSFAVLDDFVLTE